MRAALLDDRGSERAERRREIVAATGREARSGSAARWSATEVDLIRSSRREGLVKARCVAPAAPQVELVLEGLTPEGKNDNAEGEFVLDRPYQAPDNGDASVLANRP